MISIIVSARNLKQQASNCLAGLLESIRPLGIEQSVEYVLVDDASDAGSEIVPLFLDFRSHTKSKVQILRFRARQHYSRGLAYAFSAAHGDSLLFVSHDMVATPSYFRAILGVAALDSSIGLVRGTSPYVDCFPEHVIPLPVRPRGLTELFRFAEFVHDQYGLSFVEDRLLTGDSMLIKRGVIDKIGVFDPRYFGYFGDIDFGLRLQRAGFKMVCAKGAWLLHEGAAYYKHLDGGVDFPGAVKDRMKVVQAAYEAFREKWGRFLPEIYPGTANIDFAKLREVPTPSGGEFQPAMQMDHAIVEIL
ncbi:MAG: glycosyltransferase [Planctomycetota bacterium]|nr:glycosyltransferase [Planctomycetota bacterium]